VTTSGLPQVSQVSWPAFPALGVQRMSPINPGATQLSQLLAQHNGSSRPLSPGRSDMSRDDSNLGDDSSSIGAKDDDDDDDDDDGIEEGSGGDPERLKAFNMFVRLFVDENLDRHVPISKQPKEKIQAIIDSCARQFPEFSERARKRIRTYLKSCRRTKRSREQAGLDSSSRPTPPHLTSVVAEQLLARACENEADNAKRMRMGIEPVAQPMPLERAESPPSTNRPQDQLLSLLAGAQQPASPPSFPGRQGMLPSMGCLTGPPVFGSSPMGLLPATNGGGGDKKPPLLNHKLSGAEMTAVRQLITGYRESAAFLLRSADELENLMSSQPRL